MGVIHSEIYIVLWKKCTSGENNPKVSHSTKGKYRISNALHRDICKISGRDKSHTPVMHWWKHLKRAGATQSEGAETLPLKVFPLIESLKGTSSHFTGLNISWLLVNLSLFFFFPNVLKSDYMIPLLPAWGRFPTPALVSLCMPSCSWQPCIQSLLTHIQNTLVH